MWTENTFLLLNLWLSLKKQDSPARCLFKDCVVYINSTLFIYSYPFWTTHKKTKHIPKSHCAIYSQLFSLNEASNFLEVSHSPHSMKSPTSGDNMHRSQGLWSQNVISPDPYLWWNPSGSLMASLNSSTMLGGLRAAENPQSRDKSWSMALWLWAEIKGVGKTLIWKETCPSMFTAAVFTIARTWKQPKCPSAEKWIKKMWCMCTM